MEVEEVRSYLHTFNSYCVKPLLGVGWFLLLFLFLLFIFKYVKTTVVTMRPSLFKRKGVSEREAKQNYNQNLTMYYELDEMARPIVFGFILFLIMSVVLYTVVRQSFVEVLKDGVYLSCAVLPFLYFYYGDESRFFFNMRS